VVEHGAIERALAALPPAEQLGAGRDAAELARRLEFLPWADRAAALDDYYWRQANARLTHELITVVVNRCGCDLAAARRLEGFVRYCRTVTTAVLLRLDEGPRVTGGAAALTWRLSQVEAQQAAAEAWLDAGHQDEAALELKSRPGYAFLLLGMCPSDSAESFTARDAFFAAVLGA
jgi:hypothetical protein